MNGAANLTRGEVSGILDSGPEETCPKGGPCCEGSDGDERPCFSATTAMRGTAAREVLRVRSEHRIRGELIDGVTGQRGGPVRPVTWSPFLWR